MSHSCQTIQYTDSLQEFLHATLDIRILHPNPLNIVYTLYTILNFVYGRCLVTNKKKLFT